eukprot:9682352-Karenia_brevis.AAC.1
MVPDRQFCQQCDSMLCAPCEDLHTWLLAARGMTYCQLWSHGNNRQMHTDVVMNGQERDLPPRGLLNSE